MPNVSRPGTPPTTGTTRTDRTQDANTAAPAAGQTTERAGSTQWQARQGSTTRRGGHAPAAPAAPNVPTGGAAANSPLAGTPALSPIHFQGEAKYTGAVITDEALTGEYQGVPRNEFGTTRVANPAGGSTLIHDNQYKLDDGSVGMHLIPVKDDDPAANKAMDDYIRKKEGLGPKDHVFALLNYIHPERAAAPQSIKDLATASLATENNTTHMGAYYGQGKTLNSPENYHSKTWETKGYPANVTTISLEGVKQSELNKNLYNTGVVQNKGVEFPGDYKNDPYRTTDLNTTLMFYRDWIKNESYLHDDNSWKTYCAEHQTNVVNIGLNLPHNEASFKEVFGKDEGAALWAKYKAKYKEATGKAFTAADETHFTPLWKKAGLDAKQIRPPTKAEYDDYQKARFDGRLDNGTYTGKYKPLAPGVGMAWKPETTADLVKNFVETYSSFRDVGGFGAAAAVMGFMDPAVQRTGIGNDKYLEAAMPIVNKMMIAEAMARGPASAADLGAWTKEATGKLYVAFGGKPEDFAPGGTVNPKIMGLAQAGMKGLAAPGVADQIARAAALPADKRNDFAYGWMRREIQTDLDNARNVRVANSNMVEAYTPPAVLTRITNGMVEKSPFVTIKTIATAVDDSDVKH